MVKYAHFNFKFLVIIYLDNYPSLAGLCIESSHFQPENTVVYIDILSQKTMYTRKQCIDINNRSNRSLHRAEIAFLLQVLRVDECDRNAGNVFP